MHQLFSLGIGCTPGWGSGRLPGKNGRRCDSLWVPGDWQKHIKGAMCLPSAIFFH
jgi:hypothetical protein